MKWVLLFLLPTIALASAGSASAQPCTLGSCYSASGLTCTQLGLVVGSPTTCTFAGGPGICCTSSGSLPGGITGITVPTPPIFTNPGTLVGDVVSRFLLFAISLAGIYFLYRLITAGYTYLTSIGDPGKIQSGTKQLTNAITGLVLVISAFFIAQILESIFGINIV